MTIQETLAAFLSAHGQHALAQQALQSAHRLDWVRLGDEAIRSAPEYNRTHVAHTIKLALDAPENGGGNSALDFEMRPEPHVEQPGITMYRAWVLPRDSSVAEDAGLACADPETLKRRIVGLYTARKITLVHQQ